MENVRARGTRLCLEHLENRVAPVVGALANAPAVTDSDLDGVVRVESPQHNTCSGSLLSGGRHILTAAHCADRDGDHVADGPMSVRFALGSGTVRVAVDPSAVHVAPSWTGLADGRIPSTGGDWAIITLPEEAPAGVQRYDLFRGDDEIGRQFLVVGYGVTGNGADGSDLSTVGTKRFGFNRFDADRLDLGGDRMPAGTGLFADFDNGTAAQDAFGSQFGLHGLGYGPDEAMIGPGDSGGPALMDVGGRWVIAGIASFASSSASADVDHLYGRSAVTNNSFGEYFAYTRVSTIAEQIDQVISATPPVDSGPAAPPISTSGLRPVEGNGVGNAGSVFAIGADQGAVPRVQLRGGDGGLLLDGLAYSSAFLGGVRTAAADVTGDGIDDLIAVPGQGTATWVKVFDGASGSEVTRLLAFESAFLGGAFVTACDLNGDRHAEIIVSADLGGGPRVRVLSGADGSVLADFLGIDDPNFRGGARLGLGDVNADGVEDLLVGAGFGGGPRVAVYDGASLGGGFGRKLVSDFFVFEPEVRNGVFLDGGDFDGDGKAEVAVGGGPGGGPRVLIISGAELLGSFGRTLMPVANFFAGDVEFRGGVRVTTKDLDRDGTQDLVVGPGEGGGSTLRLYHGGDLISVGTVVGQSLDVPGIGNGLFVG